MELNEDIKKLGLEVFGDENNFLIWLNLPSLIMPNKPINYPSQEIYNELINIIYGNIC